VHVHGPGGTSTIHTITLGMVQLHLQGTSPPQVDLPAETGSQRLSRAQATLVLHYGSAWLLSYGGPEGSPAVGEKADIGTRRREKPISETRCR